MLRCTNDTDEGTTCGGTSFDLATTVMLTLDASGTPAEATSDLDGFHKDPNSIMLTCRECGENVVLTDERHQAVVIALIRQEKLLGASLGDFSSYTFEDGTVVAPDEIEQAPMRDVAAGSAYQEAVKHQEQYRAWKAAQSRRVEAGEIDVLDLNVMQVPWMQSTARLHAALLRELAPASAQPLETV